MQMYKNELVIYRGEAFTLDYEIKYQDGTPYIVSNKLDNPYLLLSISNTAFSQNKREVRNYWYPLSDKPRFTLTEPLDIQDFKKAAENGESLYSSFDDITSFPIKGVYLNGEFVSELTAEHAVFSNSLEPGKFKYWKNGKWNDYALRLVQPFTSNDTKEWLAQKYYYTIQLVNGTDLRNYLLTLYNESYPNEDADTFTNYELYNSLKDTVDFPEDFDITQPLAIIAQSIPLLSPVSITVISYMQGDITW